MKLTGFILNLAVAWTGIVAVAAQSNPDSAVITMETTGGDIRIMLFTDKAPVTCANFLSYVEKAGHEGGEFYRTVTMANQPDNKIKIEVIQGGFNLQNIDTGSIEPIVLERTSITGLTHRDGTISMARSDPNSASTEFFICIGDQPSLDFGGLRNPDGHGFSAFGRVISGMDVVRKIQGMPCEGQTLTPPVKINRIVME
jgi:peptidyl-prolyl cis-trans isomerase A (cyclophilin A)